MTLEIPRDDPEFDGLTKTGKFKFFLISLIKLFLTSLTELNLKMLMFGFLFYMDLTVKTDRFMAY